MERYRCKCIEDILPMHLSHFHFYRFVSLSIVFFSSISGVIGNLFLVSRPHTSARSFSGSARALLSQKVRAQEEKEEKRGRGRTRRGGQECVRMKCIYARHRHVGKDRRLRAGPRRRVRVGE